VLKVKDQELVIEDIYENKQLKKFVAGVTHLLMQCDGNLVAYVNWDPKWYTNTFQDTNKPLDSNALPTKVVQPHTFYMGGAIMASPNKQYNLIYQWDGNVVLKKGSSPVGITGKLNGYKTQFDQFLILQGDGNLVQYLTNPTRPIWATNKMTGHSLQITDNGRFEVLDDKDTVVYSNGFSRRLQKQAPHNETTHSRHNVTDHALLNRTATHHNVTDRGYHNETDRSH